MMRTKEEIKKSFLLICITSNHKYDEGSTQLIKYSNVYYIKHKFYVNVYFLILNPDTNCQKLRYFYKLKKTYKNRNSYKIRTLYLDVLLRTSS